MASKGAARRLAVQRAWLSGTDGASSISTPTSSQRVVEGVRSFGAVGAADVVAGGDVTTLAALCTPHYLRTEVTYISCC
jgi:hypothetical protein